MSGFIFLLSPIFLIYTNSGDISLLWIPLTQWLASSALWEQKFSKRKTLLLWTILSFLSITFCFIKDRLLFYFGFESYYHPIVLYIYLGFPTSLFWWVYRVLSLTQKNRFADWFNRR